MKAVLFFCLLAFMTCEKDIIDIGKCIYKAPLVKELINDVILAIATKDYSKLLFKIKKSLPELIQIVLGCLIDTKAIEDQTKLNSVLFEFTDFECWKNCLKQSSDKKSCIDQCPVKRYSRF